MRDLSVGVALRGRARRSHLLRRMVRWRRASRWLTPWSTLPPPPQVAPDPQPVKVLLGTNVGGHLNGTVLEAALGAALTLRGQQVEMLLCDAALPACLECTYVQIDPDQMGRSGPQSKLCGYCHRTGTRSIEGLDIRTHALSQFLTAAHRDEAREVTASVTLESLTEVHDLQLEGLRIGEHALAGTLRFFARATLSGTLQELAVLRRYVNASVLMVRGAQALLRREHYDVAVFHHGIYVPQGLLGEVCRAEGVRVVNWNPGYRSSTFIFSHGNTYHHTMMDEPTSMWEDLGWDADREAEVLDYLQSRWTGSKDWIYFHREPQDDLRAIEYEVGIDFSARPTIGLLTNVMWDAQLHYPANAFPSMLDWVLDTVAWFADHPELQLLIRVHPAEITGWLPSRQRIIDEVRSAFPVLPDNVFVVGPDSRVSTYAAMLGCDSVIIFGTKTGVELTSFGVPVIVAGEAWIRGKGVTQDVGTREEYRQILATLPRGHRLDKDTVTRARQYAYHFFFRRMIPLPFMQPTNESIPVYHAVIPSFDELVPGRHAGLDVVCDGITRAAPFVFPADARSGSTAQEAEAI